MAATASPTVRPRPARAASSRLSSGRPPGPPRSATRCSSRSGSASIRRTGAATSRRQIRTPATSIRMVEQCTAGCAANGNIPGLIYRSQSNDLFISGLNLNSHHQLAGERVVRHRRAQLQGRVRVEPARRSAVGEPGAEQPGLPREQRRAEPVHDVDQQLPERPLDARRRLLRPGAVDAQASHAAGRACASTGPVSWAPEQQEGPVRFLPTADLLPRDADRGQLQRPHAARRGGRTTCSATARRRSRRRSASIWRRRSPAAPTRAANPTSRIIQSVNRAWTDANGNCDD